MPTPIVLVIKRTFIYLRRNKEDAEDITQLIQYLRVVLQKSKGGNGGHNPTETLVHGSIDCMIRLIYTIWRYCDLTIYIVKKRLTLIPYLLILWNKAACFCPHPSCGQDIRCLRGLWWHGVGNKQRWQVFATATFSSWSSVAHSSRTGLATRSVGFLLTGDDHLIILTILWSAADVGSVFWMCPTKET